MKLRYQTAEHTYEVEETTSSKGFSYEGQYFENFSDFIEFIETKETVE